MTSRIDTARPQVGAAPGQHPIERILPLLKKVRALQNGRGHAACCPAHNDESPSLSVWEDGERVGLCCFAGCSQEAILSAIGLTWRDLYPEGRMPPAPVGGITMYDLAQAKLIHPHFLDQWGITDATYAGQRAVRIPYYTEDGTEYERTRFRTALAGGRFKWDTKSKAPLIPYGLNHLEEARKAGYLVIPEGESDCWALWQARLPALGVPGVGNTKALGLSMVEGVKCVYIIKEPPSEKDIAEGKDPGQTFVTDVKKHLTTLGYKGKLYALDLQASHGVKDPNELLKREGNVKSFKAAFETALLRALPLFKQRQKPKVARLLDLQQEVLPETRWAIDPILPEGVTILGGKPKLGKSWLALAMLAAIASGGAALGQYPVERGEVLYISLEDNKKRLQKRANTFLDRAQASPDFYYAIDWPRLGDGGLEDLAEWIDEHPRARLICIDTWARFKPKVQGGRSQAQYDEDYDALQPLQRLAGEKGVSILVIDHMRKMESEDPLDMVSGSTGKTGAVDGFLLLYRKRGETDARLFVIGRDIEEEQELFLKFDQQCASWIVKSDEEIATTASTPERQAILDLLLLSEKPLAAREIAEKLGKNHNTVRELLKRLRAEEKITLTNNVYSVVSVVNHSQRSQRSQRSQGNDKSLTTVDKSLTTPDYGSNKSVVRVDTPSETLSTSLENNSDSGLTTLTTVTTDNWKRRIQAYGDARGFPRLQLSNKVVIPAGEVAWRGFLKHQNHLWQQAYEDICNGSCEAIR